MRERLHQYWQRFWQRCSVRERWLLGIMVALIAVTILWFAVYRPMNAGLETSRHAYFVARQRHFSVIDKMTMIRKALATQQKQGGMTDAILVERVTTAAATRGLDLDTVAQSGANQLRIYSAAAPVPAVLDWIDALETQDIIARSVSLTPARTVGHVDIQIELTSRGAALSH